MKTYYVAGMAMLAGFVLGIVTVQGLHAAGQPPVYYVSEIDLKDPDGYMKEFAPKARASIKANGGRILAASQAITAFDGTPPKSRVAIIAWDSVEQIKAWKSSDQYKDDQKIGDQYATFRTFAVEGLK